MVVAGWLVLGAHRRAAAVRRAQTKQLPLILEGVEDQEAKTPATSAAAAEEAAAAAAELSKGDIGMYRSIWASLFLTCNPAIQARPMRSPTPHSPHQSPAESL